MDYPIKFESCPVCGSKSRIIEMETNEEIEKGNLSSETRIPVLFTQSKLFNPDDKTFLLARRQITVIMCFFDVCSDCGTLYAVEVQKGIGMIEPQIIRGPMPPGQDMPSFFGKG